jgi:hypothetical protein
MNVTGFAGLLVPGPVTVYTGAGTDFGYGLNSLTDIAAASTTGANIRVVGLLIKDPLSGKSVILARHIDLLTWPGDFSQWSSYPQPESRSSGSGIFCRRTPVHSTESNPISHLPYQHSS